MPKSPNQPQTFVTNGSQINKSTPPETQAVLARYQFLYSVIGLLVGLVCVFGGIYLFIHGVSGSTDWYINVLGAESKIAQAAPGAILFVVGIFLVFITRYKFKHIEAK
ncbi:MULTISPECIES: hypothetical protein [Vibrio]|uniref:Uncharacterized protein n=1 Tax=Vibrio alfacsensis TaxID=1074311 RepID=A0ABN5PG10_9VIBR|nr:MULTISPECIES: hypothetical protein [Vibrio]AXY01238.1 hypothetical protein D1115_08590 [Vibrio alfacsensis]MCG9550279.1 hypothetical protein [Vibrio harveyi]GEA22822.1 hypothetical protein VH1807_contig00028-0018 [Vibrio harveyi]